MMKKCALFALVSLIQVHMAAAMVSSHRSLDTCLKSFVLFSVVQFGNNMGFLDLDVVPEDAEVFIDGVKKGICDHFDGIPDYLFLEPGTYQITFRMTGYLDYSRKIKVRAGHELEFNTRLELRPAGPEASSRDVFDYDDLQGVPSTEATPEPPAADNSLEHGQSEDRNIQDTDQEESATSDAAAVDTSRVEQTPSTSTEGYLKCRLFPKEASLYLDDHFHSLAEQVNDLESGIVVSPGKHSVDVVMPGYASAHQEINVEPGKTYHIRIILLQKPPQTGTEESQKSESEQR